ncbi:putative signal peptide protein [Puccinia sorghi]|uniref:Putative signal peptide protein n=1 Tax=Puccinia sorghi TaxID=27349 RepID=A0A0L6UDT4_9BASI|nr:putative signal peptide protein [Puccinia sorghi]
MFWNSYCAVCAVTVHQSLAESILENVWSKLPESFCMSTAGS